jgi:hypothetical protein
VHSSGENRFSHCFWQDFAPTLNSGEAQAFGTGFYFFATPHFLAHFV